MALTQSVLNAINGKTPNLVPNVRFRDDQKTLHRADSRGKAFHGWLRAAHSFSFAGYYNPSRMNFGLLRVLNDDTVAASSGFDTHPHRDMEIVTIPLKGALKHEDSEGNGAVLRAGEVQFMSAGSGIQHSERNASSSEDLSLLQIWVMPKKLGIEPRYGQKAFDAAERKNRFQTLVSNDGREGSLEINQDAFFSRADVDAGEAVRYERKLDGNGLYVFVIKGQVLVAGERLGERDAIGLTDVRELEVLAEADADVLVIDVPMRD